MPLFLIPPEPADGAGEIPLPVDPRAKETSGRDPPDAGPEELRRHLERAGIRPKPIDDQIALQLAFLDARMATLARFPPPKALVPWEAPTEP